MCFGGEGRHTQRQEGFRQAEGSQSEEEPIQNGGMQQIHI